MESVIGDRIGLRNANERDWSKRLERPRKNPTRTNVISKLVQILFSILFTLNILTELQNCRDRLNV